MTSTFKRIIVAAIALIALAGIACALVVSPACSSGQADPVDEARNGAVNTLIDLSGIKDRIDSEARAKAGEIAAQAGVPRSVVENVVDSLAIKDWQVTSLPADAVQTGTYAIEADDLSAQITTYDDPGVVTIRAYGQDVTMAVPDSAQSYVPLVKYLEYVQ